MKLATSFTTSLALYLPIFGQGTTPPEPANPPVKLQGVPGGVVGGVVGGTGKVVEYQIYPDPTQEEETEMKIIIQDLYPMLLHYFQTVAIVKYQSNENGNIKISDGFEIYEDPYPAGKRPTRRPWSNVEGPSKGCYLIRAQLAMNGADAPISRGQIFEHFIFGKWYYAKVPIPQRRYAVWFDYISSAPNSFEIQSEIRKIIQSIVSKRIK